MQQSRIWSALFVGLGVALIVGGLVAPRFLLGDGRLPLDLGDVTWTIEDPNGMRDGKSAPVTRQLHLEIRDPSDADVASVRVGDSVRAGEEGSDFDNLVTASTWAFELDRVSGEASGPAQVQLIMGMPATEVEIDGVWLKFPADVRKETYDVFDTTLRGTAPAEFIGEEEIAGRTIYRFRQDIAPTNIAQRYADPLNTGIEEGADGEQIRTFLYHSAERELLVDQVSGLVVGIEEKVDQYYGDASGKGIQNIVLYDGTMDPAQVEALVQDLGNVTSAARSQTVTWIAIGLGALLAIAGLIGAIIGARRRS